jgi:hypothetical protein
MKGVVRLLNGQTTEDRSGKLWEIGNLYSESAAGLTFSPVPLPVTNPNAYAHGRRIVGSGGKRDATTSSGVF